MRLGVEGCRAVEFLSSFSESRLSSIYVLSRRNRRTAQVGHSGWPRAAYE
jgi:hypothetical protein